MRYISCCVAYRLAGAGIAGAAAAVAAWFCLAGYSREFPGAGVAGIPTPVATPAQQPEQPRRKYLILACDGGGVRGALTARIVQKIEEELKKKTGEKFTLCKRVDCFAGTSTGGIIAIGLACDKRPEELVALYEKSGEKIFRKYDASDAKMTLGEKAIYNTTKTSLNGLNKLLDYLPKKLPLPSGWSDEAATNLFFPRYDSSGLREVLEEAYKDEKTKTLAQLAPKRSVLVTTLRLGRRDEAWRPFMLHNLLSKDDPDDQDAKLGRETTILDAALCTSAAPTYFAPHKHPKLGFCADGGVFANNPGVAALSLACRAGQRIDDVRVISVGTGSVTNYMKVPPWKFVDEKAGGTRCGMLAWLLPKGHDGVPATPLITAMFDTGAAADEIYCKGILAEKSYRRIQVRLEKNIDLDDAKAIPELIKVADNYFKTDAWIRDREWLLKNIVQ